MLVQCVCTLEAVKSEFMYSIIYASVGLKNHIFALVCLDALSTLGEILGQVVLMCSPPLENEGVKNSATCCQLFATPP